MIIRSLAGTPTGIRHVWKITTEYEFLPYQGKLWEKKNEAGILGIRMLHGKVLLSLNNRFIITGLPAVRFKF